MAQLVTKDTIEKQVTTTVKEDVIVLRLNKSQAATLHQIVRNVGGPASTTARKFTRELELGLIELGVEYANHPKSTQNYCIYFNEGFDPRYPL